MTTPINALNSSMRYRLFLLFGLWREEIFAFSVLQLRAGFADVVEEHVRHVVGDHGAEVEGVAAVPLAVAGPGGDRELETRLLVPCKGDTDSHNLLINSKPVAHSFGNPYLFAS